VSQVWETGFFLSKNFCFFSTFLSHGFDAVLYRNDTSAHTSGTAALSTGTAVHISGTETLRTGAAAHISGTETLSTGAERHFFTEISLLFGGILYITNYLLNI
jgi:hypothetical protein